MAVTLYWIVQPDATATPTGAQIVAGQDGTGGAALASGSEAYTAAGTYSEASAFSGLSANIAYEQAWVAYDGSTYSSVVTATIRSAALVTPSLIASTAAIGAHTASRTAVASDTPSIIASTATIGSHTVSRTAVAAVTATRIESAATVGAHTVARASVASVTTARIESTASIGSHAVSANGLAAIAPARIESTVTFGTASISYVSVRAVTATRIESAAAVGAHTVARSSVAPITPGRIDSAASLGVPTVSSSSTAQIVVTRIASTATFGAASVVRTGPSTGTWPDPATVLAGIVFGPTGSDYTGTLAMPTAADIRSELAPELARIVELYQIHGLEIGSPLEVSTGQRTAAAIVQSVAEAAGVVTVTRQ